MTESQPNTNQSELDEYGKLITKATCAGKTIFLYSHGYVRVGGLFRSANAPFEKLLGISGSADVAKKSAAGRAIGAVLTGGNNLVFSPNKRGDIYLTIVTETKTHALHISPPTKSDLQAMHQLVAAGEAILQGLQNSSASSQEGQRQPESTSKSTSTASTSDLLSKLQQLNELRTAGVVSDAEFIQLKERILSDQGEASELHEDTQIRSNPNSTYSLVLVETPPKTGQKIDLIKTVRSLFPQYSLKDAKNAVDNPPHIFATELNENDAHAIKIQFEAQGARVELKST